MYIKNNLKYLRQKKNISLRKLGELSNVPHTVIERIEKGQTIDPHLSTVCKLINVLEVDIEDFLFRDLENVLVTGTKNK